jgi:thioredoxin-like negative regulator of GroEL
LLREFPASREYSHAQLLIPLAEYVGTFKQEKLPDQNENDAAFRNAMRLVSKGNLEAAMDGLLGILRRDKRYHGGSARQCALAILEMFGEENPLTSSYRRELSNILF